MRIFGTLKAVIAFGALTGAAAAERVDCAFAVPCLGAGCVVEEVALRFEIDPSQFVDAHVPGEPPRNKVTWVTLGDVEFEAEPIRMADGTRGFWANVAGVEHLMTTRADGMGTYASTGAVPYMSGRCKIRGAP